MLKKKGEEQLQIAPKKMSKRRHQKHLCLGAESPAVLHLRLPHPEVIDSGLVRQPDASRGRRYPRSKNRRDFVRAPLPGRGAINCVAPPATLSPTASQRPAEMIQGRRRQIRALGT